LHLARCTWRLALRYHRPFRIQMSRVIYLYCVVRSDRKPRASGVPPGLPGAERPTVVKLEDQLWLVTASVPLDRYGSEPLADSLRNLDWVASIALAHEAVVEYFVRAPGAAVIPMKLFTMFSTDARAAAEMQKRRGELDRVFQRIDGCEEWGVRVTRAPVRAAPRKATGSITGAGFLAARKQARDHARNAALATADAADAAFLSLAQIAREGRRRTTEPAGVPAPVLDAAFLVPAQHRARFHAAAERLAKEVAKTGGEMTLTGPWPPYNFVDGVPQEGST
jgi:hypothetical protein